MARLQDQEAASLPHCNSILPIDSIRGACVGGRGGREEGPQALALRGTGRWRELMPLEHLAWGGWGTPRARVSLCSLAGG